jgi:N6-adenosine-specific RNA methylase IME4
MTDWPFGDLPRAHYGAIYADPPWRFEVWAETGDAAHGVPPYERLTFDEIGALPVASLAAENCVLFMWVCWPSLPDALKIIEAWGFAYKTCGFAWVKGDNRQADLFRDDHTAYMGLGYWTRANSEVCLLATRGHPKRINADVRQGIIEPRREHSRKPDCVPARIERLVAGPYLELFARTTRPGWDHWGNETGKFAPRPYNAVADAIGSYNDAVQAIGERVKAGDPVPEFFLPEEK